MGDYYGYTWAPGSVNVAEHDTYVPEGTTHLQRVTDFSDADKVAHIRVLWPMIQGLDPEKMSGLAQTWRKLSTQLTNAKGGLDGAGGQLAPQWTGEASRAFLERVGGALFSLDQWIDAASTNAATIDRLSADVRTTQIRVEGIYRAWLMESANEKAKRNADAEGITLQDANDIVGFLSQGNTITDGGYLYRWARDSIPQTEIDQKYTAQALPLVRALADHFASAAATGISLPGKFKGPTTFKRVQPTLSGTLPGLPPARPTAPVAPAVPSPVLPPAPPAAPGAPPVAPALPLLPPGRPPAVPGAIRVPSARPAAPPVTRPAAPARPALPALPGRNGRGARPAVPQLPAQARRGAAKPSAPALPGRTRAPGVPPAPRPTSARGTNGRPGAPAANPRLGGRTSQPTRPTSLGQTRSGRPGSVGQPAPQPRLPGRVGVPSTPTTTPTGEPPEFRRSAPQPADATTVGTRPPATTSLGGRRGAPEPPLRTTVAGRPELTGRAAPQGTRQPDTRPAVDARRPIVDPVVAPEEAFAPTESAPPVIERLDAPVVQAAGPALGRS